LEQVEGIMAGRSKASLRSIEQNGVVGVLKAKGKMGSDMR
jgi:hypothetical protein